MAKAKVKEFTIKPLKFDEDLVKQVMQRRKKGQSIAKIAKELKVGAGKAAMAELIGSNPKRDATDSTQLARFVAKDRKAGDSWGLLAARYRITEPTARAAFEAATGKPAASIDYRKKS